MQYNVKGKNVILRKMNSSRKYFTGYTGTSTYKELYTVLGQVDEPQLKSNGSTGYNRFLIQFENGYISTALNSALYVGHVTTPYTPKMRGVGYRGEGVWVTRVTDITGKIKNTKEYTIWAGMFRRSYDPEYHKRQPTYKNCTVDSRWFNYQTFCEDIKNLPNYEVWKGSTGQQYQFDKDIRIKGNKVYSMATCIFVTKKGNNGRYNKKQNITGLTYRAIRLADNKVFTFTNQRKFSEEHGLDYKVVNSHIMGKRMLHGWNITKTKNSSKGQEGIKDE